jgi:hypothetical protein
MKSAMQVMCNANHATALPPKYFVAFGGNSHESIFHVSVGTEYLVFGMAAYNGVIVFLVLDDTHKPNWYPIEFFSVTDPKLPADWLFSRNVANEHGIDAIWGYKNLITDPKHYEDLIEREPEALKIFEKQRLDVSTPD